MEHKAPTLEQPLRPRPFAPKVLFCFVVATLCLAWLVSLQSWRVERARLTPNPAAAAVEQPAPPPRPVVKFIEAPATLPPRTLSESDFSLAEVETIHSLVAAGDTLDYKLAANMLRPYTYSTNTAVRDLATREFENVAKVHDKAVLNTLSSSIETAKDLAAKQDFAGALNALRTGLKKIPADGTLSNTGPENVIKVLIGDYENQRKQARNTIFNGLEEGVRKKDPAALDRLENALKNSDPEISAAAKQIEERVFAEARAANTAALNLERNAREQWVRFFKRLSGTIAEGDFSNASELCENPPFDVILKGGTPDPNKILRLCSADVQAIQVVYDEALADAKGLRKQVSFHLRKGGQAAGTLLGVNGKMLRINPGKGAELGVKITDLTADGVKALMDSGIRKKPHIRLALAALEAYESPNDAESIITSAYQKEGQGIPAHWSERFRIEKLNTKVKEAEDRLAALKKAIDAGNSDEIKAALEESKAITKDLSDMNALSEDSQKLLASAEKVAAKKQLASAVLQNGVTPDANFKGINTDQISEYRDYSRRTDVGVGYGLRLGASGGLQRALIKFDGLESIVGNARVSKATLELYQITSPQAENASVGIFRVKRPWIPDSGSWLGYDKDKGHDWSIPGASGAEDIEPKEESNVILDKKTNVWRQFDVTKYIQDVLGGKAQNNGMLLKVVNGEPDYHVRFYPETDLDRGKEKSLRPKLILELLRDAE